VDRPYSDHHAFGSLAQQGNVEGHCDPKAGAPLKGSHGFATPAMWPEMAEEAASQGL
jgi:hypothetical protein